jgi:UDP-2,4-diacetamido-2,4,6-trideoxy-beta-L-altropyranose hydrolase
MKRKVIFRCDAGHAPEIGTGHITRSKTLANNLVEKGFLRRSDIIFYTRNDPDYDLGEKYLAESGYEYQVFANNELEANSSSELNILKNSNAILIVMDRLETTDDLIKGVSSSEKKIITFDDYGSGRVFADLAISAIFDNVCTFDNLVRGYEYLVLSKSSYRPLPVRKNVAKIVATFGGHDARNLCQFFLENSSGIPDSCSVDIILGSCKKSLLQKYIQYIESKQLDHRFKLHVFPENYHEIIANADLAVTSGGLSIFEFSAYGVPTIGLPQYEHQLRTIENLRDAGISFLGSDGMAMSSKNFKSSLSKMIHDFNCRNTMAMSARKSIDGGGVHRIIKLLTEKFPDIFYA